MMWSVIIFENDNSIEAVPSTWFFKNKCAWPKKNVKKYIEKQVVPNKTDFYFFKARKVGKDVDNYLNARARAKKGENTSNFSDNVDENLTKLKKRTMKKIFPNKKDVSMWSPDSCPGSYSSENDDNIHDMPNTSSVFPDDLDFNYDREIKKTSLGQSPKRKLVFDDSPARINKFKLNSPTNFDISSAPMEFQSNSVDSIPAVVADNTNDSPDIGDIAVNKIILTTASPFKITNYNDTTTKEKTEPCNLLPLTSSSLQSFTTDSLIDKVNKIYRTTLNTWYEVKSMNEKIEKLETNFFMLSRNNLMQIHTDENYSFDSMNTFEFMIVLPLKNEENLTTFEKNLLDINLKKKVVSKLLRLVRSTIQSTTRAILRYLFDDSFLQNYSYKGQKQKQIFSTLAICSVIFESIKNIGKFQNYNKIDVEQAIKIFIASAKFREQNKLKTNRHGATDNVL